MSKVGLRYIGKIRNKTWYISDIFQKDEKVGELTKDALLYQDILEYSHYNPNFKRRHLDKWLIQKNTEFVNDYSDLSTRNITYSNRIHAKKDRIDRVFNNLLNGGLISVSGTRPSEKQKKLDVEVYSSKKLGELVWLTIKSMNLENEIQQAKKKNEIQTVRAKTKVLNDNNHCIYQLIISLLAKGKNVPSKAYMLRAFFDKLERRGLFGNFVSHFSDVCSSINALHDITSLVSYTLNEIINEAYDRNLFIDLWYESASELDSDSKKIFLYETKLNIEQKVIDNVIGYSKEFEKQWFANRADYDTIVLEGNCEKCKHPNILTLSHDEHRNLIKKRGIFDRISGSKQKFDCKFCDSKGSCVLATF
jgi:hypothetical protein